MLLTLPMSVAAPAPDHPMLAEYVELVRQNVGRRFSERDILASISAYDLFVYEYGFRPAAGSVTTLFTSSRPFAVTGPNGIPNAAIRPKVQMTTIATDNVVMTPSIGRRDSNQKLITS